VKNLFVAMAAGAALFFAASLHAAGFKDPELSTLADASYLGDTRASSKVYRELKRISDKKTGVQALAVERKSDNAIVVAYAGTNPKDIKDLLADLGIGAKEAEHLIIAGAAGLASAFEKQGWIPKGYGPVVRDALTGGYGGLKIGKTKAKYEGKFDINCPKGSFLDPRNGGECWSCPKNYIRSVYPVNGGKACSRPLKVQYEKADKKRKIKFGKKDCKKGEFWDVKGGDGVLGACWDCPKGYNRTVFAVDSGKACAKASTFQFSKATYKAKALCPKGAFFDPRNGGECWSCPKGYERGVAKVNSGSACLSLSWQKDAGALFDAGIKINAATENQLKVARAFLDDVLKMKTLKGKQITIGDIVIVGHSLGGFITQVVAAERNARAYTINAPGAAHYNKALKSTKTRNLTRHNDVVGRLGKHVGGTQFWKDVKFDFTKDIQKGGLYLYRNHGAPDFIADQKTAKK
jgi:hypothetical protein